jgi:hypothetical protein
LSQEECAAVASLDGNGGWWSDGAMLGFQFVVQGATLNGAAGASGGDAGAADYTMSTSQEFGTVIGFALDGTSIGPSCGKLLELDILEGTPTGITDIVFSAFAGVKMDFVNFSDSPALPGCTDASACNFDVDATEDDGSCTYPEGNFDCDGNCFNIDECGICGGRRIIIACSCIHAARY